MNPKVILRRIVDDSLLGWLDYCRSSNLEREWSGPFNGQPFRRQMVAEIFERIPVSFVVETGTFRGVTTEYLASEYAVPVFSIENNRRNYGFARARLRGVRNVKLLHGDSVAVIRRLFMHKVLPAGNGFFYLDAHWGKELPLREEVQLIFEEWPCSIVMVDDFAVPGDLGYGFDDYGAAGSCTREYLGDIPARFQLSLFFPRCPSSQEEGKRRGSVVLANQMLSDRLRDFSRLWEYQ